MRWLYVHVACCHVNCSLNRFSVLRVRFWMETFLRPIVTRQSADVFDCTWPFNTSIKVDGRLFVVVLYSPMTSTRVNNTGRHGSSVTKRRPQSVWLIISVHTESILLHKSIPGLNSVRNASRSFQYHLLFFSFLVSPEPLIYFQVACAAICCITKLLRGPFCRQWRASCRLLCASCSAVGRGGRSAVLFSQKIGCRLFLAVFTRFSVDGSIWCANSPPD